MTVKPWRLVALPQDDVAEGRYRQAEFAADLAQVLEGRADPVYQDPIEFYRRTYLTEGMSRLLVDTARRVISGDGEPVVKLKTSFGGGKTHTMLALLHLFSGSETSQLRGVSELLREAGVGDLPSCRVAVLVGTSIDPSKERSHPNLREANVRTLWGEMAAQLGGRENGEASYHVVQEADERGVAPGSDTLVELLDRYGPCLILIDELVAFARNIYGVEGLPAGSFDSNMTFIQNLTEAARRSKNSLVVASIPESGIEVGGEGGVAALERLENVYGRLEAVWQPVGHLESFEIVRRRIFSRILSEKDRDETCLAFHKMYRDLRNDFPTECAGREYLGRLKSAYPVHPEVFDRLYEDWATLERFQRTRGVLRLMAAVVHELWTQDDQSPLIMPGRIPLNAPTVRDELTRYLGEQWGIVVDKDVDGRQSEPFGIDRDSPRIGASSAARRVSRTIFMGSAPSVRQQTVRGIEDVRIRLGVAELDENLAIFADALSRLTDRLTYLYRDNQRYWYDLRPNLRRTVDDRAAQWDSHEVELELIERLQRIRERGEFAAIHITSSSQDVPDEQEVRLVVLGIQDVHRKGSDVPAQVRAREILESRGRSQRIHKNMLIFLAPDSSGLENCLREIRRHLAWKSVLRDEEQLGLDAAQRRQASEELERTDRTVDLRLIDTYVWLFLPHQEVSSDGVPGDPQWETTRLTEGPDSPFSRASQKVIRDQQLIAEWSPLLLKMELDSLLWSKSDHTSVRKLWQHLTSYLYLPRLATDKVLIEAIRQGLRTRDFFAYADGQDTDGRYLGLRWETDDPRVLMDDASLLVKADVATRQLEAEAGQGQEEQTDEGITIGPEGIRFKTVAKATRFHGSVALSPHRVSRDVAQIAEEVLAHIAGIPDASIDVQLEIDARIPSGASEKLIRTVTENAKTLKFRSFGFEGD